MYIFAVSGFSKTGKTTVVEAMVRNYSERGIRAATIKNSDCLNISTESEYTDTARHRNAGAISTVLRSPNITVMIHRKQLKLRDILAGLMDSTCDIVILEGFGSLNIPKIVTAATFTDADKRYTSNTFAFSGRLAASTASYRELPVVNCFTECSRLTALAEDRALRDIPMILERCGEIY